MLSLHPLLTDHAVIQRDEPIRISGRATPGTRISVRLGTMSAGTTTGESGAWEAVLPALSSGGPFELDVSTGDHRMTRQDIWIGEVWLCSGQSNMEWSLGQSSDHESEVYASRLPELRFFNVPRAVALKPASTLAAKWEICSPENAASIYAVPYHFARRLLPELNCPIGLIDAAWGGTKALPWVPAEAGRAVPELAPLVEAAEQLTELPEAPPLIFHEDSGNEGIKLGFARPDFDDSSWGTMPLPGYWQNRGLLHNGAVWFRIAIDVPEKWSTYKLMLCLGAIDDHDETYFNGVCIGGIGKENPNAYQTPRNYEVPASIVQPGRNVIAVRVFDWMGNGGFVGPENRMRLMPAGLQDAPIALNTDWKYFVEKAYPMPPANAFEAQGVPCAVYNGMIAPISGFPLRGFLWYQGESDAGNSGMYAATLRALVRGWRAVFGGVERPFFIVQLANYKAGEPSDWPNIRAIQAEVADSEPAMGYVVTMDVGDPFDIHPRNKRTVGARLANLALAKVYGQPYRPHLSPTLREVSKDGNAAIIRLTVHHGVLQTFDDALPRALELAGADGVFHPAEAEVKSEDTLVVWSTKVRDPKVVRHAWAANAALNLMDSAGLPVAPFKAILP